MKTVISAIGIVSLTSTLAWLAPVSQAQEINATANIAINVAAGGPGTNFSGGLTLTGFTLDNGQLGAVGTVSGQVTNPAGSVLQQLTDVPVTLDLVEGDADCESLTLTLGPISLDLLGADISVPAVQVQITAEDQQERLLRNLLCQVSRFADNPRTQAVVQQTLNRILALLSSTGESEGEDDDEDQDQDQDQDQNQTNQHPAHPSQGNHNHRGNQNR